jgi:uncharacterized membrane protein
MDALDLSLATFSRILHVTTAVIIVGGSFFLRFVLMPVATSVLADETHQQLRNSITGKWKKFVHAGIGVFLISGGFNYYRTLVSGIHRGDSLYHALLGVKILLAMAVFFLSSVIVGRSATFEGLRKESRKWLAVNLFLALVIIALSGFLKVRGTPTANSSSAETQSKILP